jgi:hypothetical protein
VTCASSRALRVHPRREWKAKCNGGRSMTRLDSSSSSSHPRRNGETQRVGGDCSWPLELKEVSTLGWRATADEWQGRFSGCQRDDPRLEFPSRRDLWNERHFLVAWPTAAPIRSRRRASQLAGLSKESQPVDQAQAPSTRSSPSLSPTCATRTGPLFPPCLDLYICRYKSRRGDPRGQLTLSSHQQRRPCHCSWSPPES